MRRTMRASWTLTGGRWIWGLSAFGWRRATFSTAGVFKDAAELEKELTLFVNNVREGAASEDIL